MTTRKPFSYVPVRYVHDVYTAEFLNVGLVMFVPGESLLLSKFQRNLERINAAFPDFKGDNYLYAISTVERGFERIARDVEATATGDLSKHAQNGGGLHGPEHGTPGENAKTAGDLARIIVPRGDNSLQLSPHVGAGAAFEPRREFDGMYDRFVTRYDKPPLGGQPGLHTGSERSDEEVWHPVEAMLRQRGIPNAPRPKRVDGRADAVEFRHAVKNGAWQVYEPLSFDLGDAERIKDKARLWLGRLNAVRDGVDEDIRLHFIVGKPRTPGLEDAYRDALEIIRGAPFETEVFEDDSVDEVALRIENAERLHSSEAG